MLYHTIHRCLIFGTWNDWNGSLSNCFIDGFSILKHIQILEIGTFGTQIQVVVFI